MNLLSNLFSQTLYIDPAATSILLSSITAIVVAVGASAIVIWRKLKKKVFPQEFWTPRIFLKAFLWLISLWI